MSPYGQVLASIPVVFQFDANGNLVPPAYLWSNLELTPQNENGLGTWYNVTFYDQNGARVNQVPLAWQFTEITGSIVDISAMGGIMNVTAPDNYTFTGTNIFSGPVSFTNLVSFSGSVNFTAPATFESIIVGTPTGGNEGPGTVNVSGGYYVNGVPIATTVISIFGRTGVVVATSGDYAVAQVTGAAPLASPTFTGTVTAATIVATTAIAATVTAKNIENIRYADQFSGATADIQINAAIADLPAAGGIVDCCGYGSSTQTLAGQVAVGSSSKCVTLRLSRMTNYQITINNASLSAFVVFPGSAIIGDAETTTTANEGTLTLASGASVNCVVDLADGGGVYAGFEISNIQINCGGSAATIATAGVRLLNALQIGTMRGVCINNFYNTTGLLITETDGGSGGGAGPINLYNLYVEGFGNAGAKPVRIVGVSSGGVMGNINFFGGTFAHPGAGGIAVIDCEGVTGNELAGVNFYGVNIESINAADIGFLINGSTGISIYGPIFTASTHAGVCCVLIEGAATDGIVVTGLNNFNLWTHNVVNSVNSITYDYGDVGPRMPLYTYNSGTRCGPVSDNPYWAKGSAGVSAGPFATISSITVVNGIVTAIAGS